MATLYFKVSSDYDEVIRLRQECEKLEAQLLKMDKRKSPGAVASMETQLASTRQQMMGLVTEAAKAGAVMENDLKKKISSTTKASEELSEEIIKQKKIIRETQEDVRRLSEQYSKMNKYSPKYGDTASELNRAKAALNEQRYSLGELQEQQAKNRLELRKLNREYKDFSQGTDKSTEIMDNLIGSLKRTAAEIGGLAAIKKFGSDVMDATGKMQQLQVALSTILQDKSKADQLIARIVQFAAKTPFNLEDVATGAKQLLAYGSSAETVVDELSMLGDVASGLQIPIGQLIYLYGTLRTQGRAMTVDIKQFAGRGIPIYEELAKVLGVAKDEVAGLVTEGEVGFAEVEQAFKNMTSEGGKFANLMENSAGTWPQRLSNIEDTLFQKMNEFGNKYKDVFEFGIGTAEDLVESLDDVISVIGSLVAAYGTYKAAVIAVAVAQKASGFVESIRLIAMFRKEMTLATAAQQAFNVASKANIYVTLLSVLVGLAAAVYMFTKRTDEATAAQKRLNDEEEKFRRLESERRSKIESLIQTIKDETETDLAKITVYEQLRKLSPAITSTYKLEELAVLDLAEANKILNKERDTNTYDSYLRNIEESTRRLERLRAENGKLLGISPSTGIPLTVNNDRAIKEEEAYLAQQKKALDNFSQKILQSNEKNEKQTTYQQDLAAAKDDWDKAKKGYEAIIKDQDATSKQVIEARNALKSAEDKYYELLGTKPEKKSKTKKVDLSISVLDEEVTLISPEEIEKNIAMHREAMDRYLTEYGDYQQKRLAIADMYALKISQAETEGEKLSLRKQSEEALKTLDFEEFKKSINFADIFSDLDTQTTTSLRALRDKLGDYINEAAKDLRPEDLKELQDAFNNLDFKIADRSPFNELKSGLLEYKSAQEAVVKAQEELNTVIAGGIVTVSEYDKATGELVSKTITQADAERNLAKALSERQGALAKLTKAANSIGAQGSEVVNAGNEIVDMLQSFGVEIPEAVSSTLEGVGQVMDGLASIDLTKPFSAITGTISVLTGIGKTIGGIFGFGGADYSEYDNMVERYSGLIDIWDELIDKKKEYIDISYGSESIKAANEALDILKKQEEVARTLAMERLSSGASIGSHSINYRMWQGSYKYDGKNWRDVAGVIERNYGVTFNGMADLLNMAPDVLQSIKDNYSGLWSVMDGDFRGYLENLIEYGDEAEGIADQLRESMAGISFDEFQNSFVDMLSDLDSTNQDFADDFEGYLQKAIFSSLVANQYKSRIKKLYDTWASYGESGSGLTSDEVQSLRNEYQSIVNDMLEQRDQIMKDFGWESSASSSGQSASSRGFGTEMTHEDAGELSGRFTAVYESNLRIEAAEQQQTIAITELRGSISALSSQTTGIYNIADETRTILANSYLELQQIRENTGEIVKPIKQMQADIAEVKRNTSRL